MSYLFFLSLSSVTFRDGCGGQARRLRWRSDDAAVHTRLPADTTTATYRERRVRNPFSPADGRNPVEPSLRARIFRTFRTGPGRRSRGGVPDGRRAKYEHATEPPYITTSRRRTGPPWRRTDHARTDSLTHTDRARGTQLTVQPSLWVTKTDGRRWRRRHSDNNTDANRQVVSGTRVRRTRTRTETAERTRRTDARTGSAAARPDHTIRSSSACARYILPSLPPPSGTHSWRPARLWWR